MKLIKKEKMDKDKKIRDGQGKKGWPQVKFIKNKHMAKVERNGQGLILQGKKR